MRVLLRSGALAVGLAVLSLATWAHAALVIYIGPGGSVGTPQTGVFAADANWNTGLMPVGDGSEELKFQSNAGAGGYVATNDFGGFLAINKLTLDNADTTATSRIEGDGTNTDALQLNGAGANISMLGAGNFTVNMGVFVNANTTVDCTGTGILDIGGILNGSAARTFTKNGPTKLVLSNIANTFPGTVVINQGTLSAASLGNAALGKMITFGATAGTPEFEYTGGTANRNYGLSLGANAGKVTVTNAVTDLTLAGAVTGSTLEKAGPGRLTLAGQVTFTGTSHTISNGTLALTNTATANTIPGTVNVVGAGSALLIKDGSLGTAAVSLDGGKLTVTTGTVLPGLLAGTSGAWDATIGAPNPNNQPWVTEPVAGLTGNRPPWADNTQWWYSGKIVLPAGPISFAENIDDNAYLAIKVGGVWNKLLDNGGWNDTTKGTITIPVAGAYEIDIRLYNGGGGAGPVGNGDDWWPDGSFGLGIDLQGRDSEIQANYAPFSAATLAAAGLSFQRPGSVAVALGANNVTLKNSSTIELQGVAPSFGTLTIDNTTNPNIDLLVTGIAGNSATFTSTTVLGSGTFTANNGVALSLGRLNDSGAVVLFKANGAGNLILDDTTAAPALSVASSFDVSGSGRLIAVAGAGVSPIGSAPVRLSGANSTLALSSKDADFTFGNPITVDSNATITAGQYASGATGPLNLTVTGALKLHALTNFRGTYNLTFSGAVSDDGLPTTINKADSGTLTFGGTASFTNADSATVINGGTMTVAATASLPQGPLSVANGATLNLQNAAQSVSSLNGRGSLVLGNAAGPANTTLTMRSNSTFDGTIADASATAKGALVTENFGTVLRLTRQSTYSGGTTIASGTTVQAPIAGSLGTGTVVMQGGTLQLSNPAQTGLIQGLLTGTTDINTTTPNPGDRGFVLEPYAAHSQKTDAGGVAWPDQTGPTGASWGDNQTWVYTGWMYLPKNTVSFQGDIDDRTQVKIDGNWIGNAGWPYGTNVVNLVPSADGWHQVEFRFQNGGGGAGATNTRDGFIASTGGAFGRGFVYNPVGVNNDNANNAGDIKPVDPGNGSLFQAYGPGVAQTYTNDLLLTGSTNTVQVDTFGAILTGSISGTGGLTKTGTGTLTVNGAAANSYAGPTSIDAGGLIFNAALTAVSNNVTVSSNTLLGVGGNVAGSVTINNSSTLSIGTPTRAAQVTLGGLTVVSYSPDTKLAFKLDQPANSDRLTVSGTFALPMPTYGVPLTVSLADWGRLQAGTYTLVTSGAGTLADWALPTNVGDFAVTGAVVGGALQITLAPDANVWTNNTLDGLWGTSGNWSKNTVPDGKSNANFGIGAFTAGGTVDLQGTSRTIKALNFGAGATNSVNITTTSTGTLILDTNIGNAKVDVAAGTHTVSTVTVANVDTDVTAAAGTSIAFNGLLGTGKTVTMNGTGEIKVVSSLSGSTALNMVLAAGSAADKRVLGSSGTAKVASTGTLTVNSPVRLTTDAGGSLTLGPVTASATGPITKIGAGTVAFTQPNTLAGGLTIDEGRLFVGQTASLAGLPADTLKLNGGVLMLGALPAVTSGPVLFRGYNGEHNWASDNFTTGGDSGTGGNGDPNYPAVAAHFNALTPSYTGTNAAVSTIRFPSIDNPNDGAFKAIGYNAINDYVTRFTGAINIPAAGTYQFRTESDDGSMIWIRNGADWTEVVRNNNWQGFGNVRGGSISFTAAGWYPIEFMQYEGGGGAGLIAQWDQGTGAWVDLANSVLGSVNASTVLDYDRTIEVTKATGSAVDTMAQSARLKDLVLDPGNLLGSATIDFTGGMSVAFGGTTTIHSAATINANGTEVVLSTVNAGVGPSQSLTKGGNGTLTLSAPMGTFTGPVRATAGKLALTATNALNGNNLSLENAAMTTGGFDQKVGTLAFNSNTAAATISGAGVLSVAGNPVTATGTNSRVTGGEVVLLTANPTIEVTSIGDVLTIGSKLTASGATLNVNGTGTLNLTSQGNVLPAKTIVNSSFGSPAILGVRNEARVSPSTVLGTTVVSLNGGKATFGVSALSPAATFSPSVKQDIGGPAMAGSTTEGPAGTWTVVGGGNDIWGTADQFHYAAAQFTGDFAVSADLTGLIPSTNAWTKAGLMARETLDAGSKWFAMLDTNGGPSATAPMGAQWRDNTNGECQWAGDVGANPASVTSYSHNVRMRMTRSGDVFEASYAPLGSDTWTVMPAGTRTMSMASTIYVGMAVTGHEGAQTATATYNNLQSQSMVPTVYANDIEVTATGSGIDALAPVHVKLQKLTMDGASVPANVPFNVGGGGTVEFTQVTSITKGAAFNVDTATTLILGETNGGTSTLAKQGSGTLLLTGATTAGPIQIQAGTLGGNAAVAAASVSIADGATLNPGVGVTPGTLAFSGSPSLTFAGTANALFDLGTPAASDRVTGIGALTYGGILNVTIPTAPVPGVYDLFDFASQSGTFGIVTMPALPVGMSWRDYSGIGLGTYFDYAAGRVEIVGPPSAVWSGLGADDNWGAAVSPNWVGGNAPIPNQKVVFAGTTRLTPFNDQIGLTTGGISFAGGSNPTAEPQAGAFTLNGNAVTVAGKIEVEAGAASPQKINMPVTLAAATVPSDTAMIKVADASTTLEITQPVGGTVGLKKTGAGLLKLTAATPSTYTGNTLVEEGNLEIVGTGINLNAATDDTIVGTTGIGATTATLKTDYVRQDTLAINDGSKVTITGTTTSVVNFLQIGNGTGGFAWGAGAGGGGVPAGEAGAAAAVPEPATWALLVMAALAGLLTWRRRR